jgi:diadenosine tetraphosphatase ApaH/serine/threonine PP2A family protein phosphatase
MKTAIISDVHANLEALTSVLQEIDTLSVDRIICLGDVVGYGGSPNECADIVRTRCDITLMGNHDAAVTGAMDVAYYYQGARDAIEWTRKQLSDRNYDWLYSLPYSWIDKDLGFYHSAPIMPSGFFYVVQDSEAQPHLDIVKRLKKVSFIGHAHLTLIFALSEGTARETEAAHVSALGEARYIVNAGSVGQPRDRDPRACFALWDSDRDTLEHRRVSYDVESAAAKIIEAGLEEKFAKRLFVGV